MFRKEYSNRNKHVCTGCVQYLMMAVSHLYLKAHLDIDDEGTPLIEGLLDDIIDAHFGIVVVIV